MLAYIAGSPTRSPAPTKWQLCLTSRAFESPCCVRSRDGRGSFFFTGRGRAGRGKAKNLRGGMGRGRGLNLISLMYQRSKCPQKVRVEHKICSSMCGTTVQAIWNHKNLTELAGGVREGQNLPQNGLNLAFEPSRGSPNWSMNPEVAPNGSPNCP